MGLHSVWGPLIAWYLFLAGTGAGAYLVGAVAGFLGERYRPLVKPGVLLGAPLVAIGCLLLLFDLGVPTRFLMAFLQPQTSMMSVGVIIISCFIVLSGVHWILTVAKKGSEKLLRGLSIAAGVFAVGTAVYTGLLLALVQAVPFWNQPLLPVLFLLSALSTGIGAVFVAVGIMRRVRPAAPAKTKLAATGAGVAVLDDDMVVPAEPARSAAVPRTAEQSAVVAQEVDENVVASAHALGVVDLPIVVAELLVLFSMMFIMGSSHSVAALSVDFLLTGGFALPFWLGIVLVGLVVPAVLEIVSLARWHGAQYGARVLDAGVITGLCLLVGGVMLRFAVVAAGLNIAVLM